VVDRESIAIATSTCVVGGGAAIAATQTDQTTPLLTFAGALIVAIITAITTNRRQSRALAGESGRHRATLTAESDRLTKQLRHDRALSDIADLRNVLEEFLAASDELAFVTLKMLASKDGEELATLEKARVEAVRGVDPGINRLQIRLPDEHDIIQGYRALLEAMHGMSAAADLKDEAAWNEASRAHDVAYRQIVEAAKPLVASQLNSG
jgi:hypothetical protein